MRHHATFTLVNKENNYMLHKTLTPKWLLTQASEAEVCRGSDTPTIYVGDIDNTKQQTNKHIYSPKQ